MSGNVPFVGPGGVGNEFVLALANEIIEGVDLVGIVSEATSGVGAEMIEDVRSGGERADDAVAAVVDRILRRNRRGVDGD